MKNLIIIILLFSAIWSCRTASRTVEKERESIDSLFIQKKDIEIKKDSSYFILSEISTTNELLNLLSALNVTYNGSNSDSLTISLNQAKSGIEVKLKGMAQANFNANTQNKSKYKDSTFLKSVESMQNIKIKSDIKNQSKVEKSKTNKESESKTVGGQFMIWIYLIIATAIIILLWWFFGKPKN